MFTDRAGQRLVENHQLGMAITAMMTAPSEPFPFDNAFDAFGPPNFRAESIQPLVDRGTALA